MSKINSSLQQVDIKTLKDLIPYYFHNRIPLYLWGRPSTGKTSCIRQFAKEEAARRGLRYSEDEYGKDIFTLKVITLSQFDSPDLRGMPEIVKSESGRSTTTFVPTEELPREGQGIIFFDEMNKADDTTISACYQIILEGRYGSLPAVKNKHNKDAFWRMAASNTENDFCNVNVSSLALLRRFSHMEITMGINDAIKYFISVNLDSRIIAFLKNSPEELFPQKWDEKLLDNKANPFPSTWENLGKMIQLKANFDTIYHLAASCIGAPVAAKFVNYCKMVDKLDMDEILKDPKTKIAEIAKMNEKASLLYAVIFSIGQRWHNKDKKVTPAKVLEITEALPAEFGTSFVQHVLEARMHELTKQPNFERILTKFGRYFDV